MPTEVQKFLTETQRQIDEEGLLGMSGTNFDRGDKPFRVLKAKQYEHRIYTGGMLGMLEPNNRKGKFASIALIAQGLNAMNQALKDGDFETVVFEDDIETYMDDDLAEKAMDTAIAKGRATPFKFNDSQKFGKNDPRHGCDDCCDFDDCWPNEEAVERSRKAQQIIMKHVAAGLK